MLAFVLAVSLFSFTRCIVPYESARMLPKGGTELKAAYTYVRVTERGEGEKLNDGLGLGLGYGVTNRVNLKVRYERISVEEGASINYLVFGPKIALIPNKIAAMLPIGAYFEEGESTWGIHPALLFTANQNNKVEGTFGLRGDIFFEEGAETLLGLNFGLGLSQNLDVWAIRPDFGLVFNPGERGAFLTFGIGAQYNIVAK